MLFRSAGEIYSKLAYCMEIDLSDEGKIKMVNAYLGTKLYKEMCIRDRQLTMDMISLERVAEYAAEDADVTLRLKQ